MQPKSINKYTTFIHFKPKASFSERETTLNREASLIMENLRNRGFYPLGFEINTKSDTKVSVTFKYQ